MNYDEPIASDNGLGKPTIGTASKSDRYYSGAAGAKKDNPVPVLGKPTPSGLVAGMVPQNKGKRRTF